MLHVRTVLLKMCGGSRFVTVDWFGAVSGDGFGVLTGKEFGVVT